MKIAKFEFTDACQEIKETWTINENDFYKWIGTAMPTLKNLYDLCDSYLRDFGDEKGYEYFRTYFEELD